MKSMNWNSEKNQKLIEERGVSFEDAVFQILQGNVLDDLQHSDTDKYPNQRIFVLNIDDYIYLVPYVENKTEVFLKTMIPSRKATKEYLRGDHDE